MFDWITDRIKSLFGKGKFIFHVTLSSGRIGKAKLAYVGDPRTANNKELKEHCIELLQEHLEPGEYVVSVEYMGTISA